MTTDPRLDRRRSGWSIVTAFAALLLCGYAVLQATASARWSDLFGTAWRLDTGQPVDDAVLAAASERAVAVVDAGECRDDVTRAAVSVSVSALDRATRVAFDRWADILEAATRVLRHAGACNPADGQRWAMLASLERAAAEEPERLAHLLELSYRRSPSEMGAVVTRSALWGRVSAATRAAAADAFANDVAILVGFGRVEDVAAAFAPASPEVRAIVRAAVAKVPPERRKAIAAAGIGWVDEGG